MSAQVWIKILGERWETSSMLLGLSDKIVKIYGFCNVCQAMNKNFYSKTSGGERTLKLGQQIFMNQDA